METLIGLLFWGGIGYYVFNKLVGKKNTIRSVEEPSVYKNEDSRFIPKTMEQQEIEAKEIAKSVKTHRGLEGLQNKIDALSDKMDEYHFKENDLMYEKTEEKQRIMESALEYAGTNPYRYYYAEDPDIDTPLVELKMIGKTISVQKYNELDEMIRDNFDVIYLEDADNIDEANEYAEDNIYLDRDDFKDLLSYRKIIESDETDEGKEKKFNTLVKKSDYLVEELELDPDDSLSLYEQYRQMLIMYEKIDKLFPLPYAEIFIANGYEFIEEIINLSDQEILGINNIGPKRLSEVKEYLKNLKQ